MEFEKSKRSKRRYEPQLGQRVPLCKEERISQGRDEMELEERMDKFYTLLGRIKDMRGLWRHGSKTKRVKPVVQPVWQPVLSIEDFDGVEGEVRKRKVKQSQEEHQKKSGGMEWIEVEKGFDLDLNLSL